MEKNFHKPKFYHTAVNNTVAAQQDFGGQDDLLGTGSPSFTVLPIRGPAL